MNSRIKIKNRVYKFENFMRERVVIFFLLSRNFLSCRFSRKPDTCCRNVKRKMVEGETGQYMTRILWVHGARLRGFVSGGRDVYRLFRCKLWPYAIEFATPRREKVFGLRVQGRKDLRNFLFKYFLDAFCKKPARKPSESI